MFFYKESVNQELMLSLPFLAASIALELTSKVEEVELSECSLFLRLLQDSMCGR